MRLHVFDFLGFHIELYVHGVEISRPHFMKLYNVYVFGWFPPKFLKREAGHWTATG